MKISIYLVDVLGVPVRIGYDVVAILSIIALNPIFSGAAFYTGVLNAALISCIYITILLHEYGHILMARRFGVQTRSVNIHIIGGLALLERMPAEPAQELLIASAGPLVNVVLALIMTGLYFLFPGSVILLFLLKLNIILIVFNLAPALPMDGGRIFRSSLGFFTDYRTATNIATVVALVCALIFVVASVVLLNPVIGLIGLFVAGSSLAERKKMNL